MTTRSAETDAWHRLPLAGVSETLTQNAACRRQLTLAGFWMRCRLPKLSATGKMGEREEAVLEVWGRLLVFGGGGGGGRKLVGMAGAQVRRGPKWSELLLGWRGKGSSRRRKGKPQAIGSIGSCSRVGRSRKVVREAPNPERCDVLPYMYLGVVGPPAGSRGASQVWGRQMGEGASRR